MSETRYQKQSEADKQKRYPSDVTDEEWEILAPLFRQKPGRGSKRTVDIREIVNACFYINRTGCGWQYLPKDFPDYRHVNYYFLKWTDDGTLEKANQTLRERLRVVEGRDEQPSAAIMDSQSVKSTETGGECGFDGGKKVKGRKRHILVDTLGLLLSVVVSAASVSDSAGGQDLLATIGSQLKRLKKIFADQTYRGELVKWVKETLKIELEIVKRPPEQVGFQVQPKRWIVERSLGWLNRFRRLSKEYDYHPECTESWIYLAFVRLMTRRIVSKQSVVAS